MYAVYDYTECEGAPSGCAGCENCVNVVRYCTLHTARKAHHGLQPGDLYQKTTGFEFQRGGKRLGYLRPRVERVGFGPLHAPVLVGLGFDVPSFALPAVAQERNAIAARYKAATTGMYRAGIEADEADAIAREVRAASDALEAFLARHDAEGKLNLRALLGVGSTKIVVENVERRAVEIRAAEVARAERKARVDAWVACGGAHKSAGERVTYQGREYVLGPVWSKWVAHSNMEYMGESVDGEVVSGRSLLCPETGAVLLRWDRRWAHPY